MVGNDHSGSARSPNTIADFPRSGLVRRIPLFVQDRLLERGSSLRDFFIFSASGMLDLLQLFFQTITNPAAIENRAAPSVRSWGDGLRFDYASHFIFSHLESLTDAMFTPRTEPHVRAAAPGPVVPAAHDGQRQRRLGTEARQQQHSRRQGSRHRELRRGRMRQVTGRHFKLRDGEFRVNVGRNSNVNRSTDPLQGRLCWSMILVPPFPC
jgi:hypothetical protein